MCDPGNHAEATPVETLPASAGWKGEVYPLEPVDELSVLTVCDNTVDILLPDQGPTKRLPLAGMARQAPMLEAPTLRGGKAADAPLAQHGFSALVEIRKGSRVRRLLFDTGMTPAGCAGNLRRLGKDPADIEAIICIHGHFDHTTGLSGLIGQLGRANLPVLIHPECLEAPTRHRAGARQGHPFKSGRSREMPAARGGRPIISGPKDRVVMIVVDAGQHPVKQGQRHKSAQPQHSLRSRERARRVPR